MGRSYRQLELRNGSQGNSNSNSKPIGCGSNLPWEIVHNKHVRRNTSEFSRLNFKWFQLWFLLLFIATKHVSFVAASNRPWKFGVNEHRAAQTTYEGIELVKPLDIQAFMIFLLHCWLIRNWFGLRWWCCCWTHSSWHGYVRNLLLKLRGSATWAVQKSTADSRNRKCDRKWPLAESNWRLIWL